MGSATLQSSHADGADTTDGPVDAGVEPEEGSDAADLSEDEFFEVLSNARRRYALHALSRTGETHTLGDLAEQVAAWENDTRVEAVTPSERKRVYTALQQLHLPKMDRAGVVAYDKDRGAVELTPGAEDIDIYLDVVRGNDIPWNEYYLGLSAVSVAVVTAAWFDLLAFTGVPDLAWAGLVALGFALSSLVHHRLSRGMQVGAGERPPELER
jgi:hypothetical protein